MRCKVTIAVVLMLLAKTALAAADHEPCSAASSVSDVLFSLALKDHGAVFQYGEIVPFVLSFTSKTANRYWADVRNHDRSEGLEQYCAEPEAPDPIERTGAFLGGGVGTTHPLDATPLTAEADVNEWRTFQPGHYRVYAVSNRVWRPAGAGDRTTYPRVSEVVRSNAIEIEVSPPDPAWQSEQLRSAAQTLAGPSSPEDAHRAARILRFLNTKDSAKQLARLFWGLNRQPNGYDLMYGLYESPYRQLVIDSMRAELAVPDHAITSDFLSALVDLQVTADPSWDPPSTDSAQPEERKAFWERRQAHARELMATEIQTVTAALSRKTGSARALTLDGLLKDAGGDEKVGLTFRAALIAAWSDLPGATQRELVQYRWSLIAGPEMLPILRRIVAEPPPPFSTDLAIARDAALQRLYELDPVAGREAILRDLQNVKAQPGLEVIKLLPKVDVAPAVRAAVERIGNRNARELDYELVDRYDDGSALGAVQAVFEQSVGKWACAPQSAMLRYFLRVAPEYGAEEVGASLRARKDTGCFRNLLQALGADLPAVQQIAVDALDDSDPELVQSAALALGRWGSADAEMALWRRLQRFHTEWADREDQLRSDPDYRSSGSRGMALEQGLISAIAQGTSWVCAPDKLARLGGLVLTKGSTQQIEGWIVQWKQGDALVSSTWSSGDNPTFSILQYQGLTADQLRSKLNQFPQGTRLRWQFYQPGQISPPVSMAQQEAFFEGMRAVAEHRGVIIGRGDRP